jgi:hypothetical protein
VISTRSVPGMSNAPPDPKWLVPPILGVPP